MKRFLCIFLFAFLCATPAHASTVTVSAYQLSTLPFNPSNIGSARSITVTATNGSATVTSSAAFPANIVGVAGFQVLINGTQYTVASIASTSSLTLTSNYGGSTGSQTMTLYAYVLLRAYATAGFQDNVTGQNIMPGTPGTGFFYKQVAVSVINSGSGNVAYIPEFTLPSTTDALINNQARYVFQFARQDGSALAFYQCGSVNQLAIPASTPTTWTAICNYNAPGGVVPPNTEVYTKSQIDQRFASCTSGQSFYFAANGNIVSCLNFGSGLTLTGNTLTAAGGAGTVTSVAQTFTGGLISVAGSPVTSSGTLALTVAGTSGGIPYFSSSSAWASSGALTANALMIGGGAGAAPSTTTTAAGILTFLGTPSSANLAAAMTDETGSGLLVFGTAPTLASTVTVGTPSGTTGAALFRGTTSGTVTLSVADAAGTWTMKLPTSAGTSGYVLGTDGSGNTSWVSSSSLLFTATQVSSNYTALTTDWTISMDTSGGNRTVTLYAASNTGKLLSVCKATTDGNTVTISDGTLSEVIYSPATCMQFLATGSVWKVQSY